MITFQDDRPVIILAPTLRVRDAIAGHIRSCRANGVEIRVHGHWISAPHHAPMCRGIERFHVVQAVSPRAFTYNWVSQEEYERAVQMVADQFTIMAGRARSTHNVWARVVLP